MTIDCPQCAVHISNEENLKSLFPEIAKEWDDKLDINHFSYKSKKIIQWKCESNHKWKDSIVNRTLKHRCCPVCKCFESVSLSARCPELVRHWDYKKNTNVSPDSISIGSRHKVYWVCSKCGRSFQCVLSQMFTDFIDRYGFDKVLCVDPVCLCPKCINTIYDCFYKKQKHTTHSHLNQFHISSREHTNLAVDFTSPPSAFMLTSYSHLLSFTKR